MRAFPAEGVDLFANYALTRPSYERPGGCLETPDRRTSRHKVNAGVQVRTRLGVDGEVTFHYSSSQRWAEGLPGEGGGPALGAPLPLDAYTLVNARAGYRFAADRAEASVTAYNLLDLRHRQHPLGQVIGRQVVGYLACRF